MNEAKRRLMIARKEFENDIYNKVKIIIRRLEGKDIQWEGLSKIEIAKKALENTNPTEKEMRLVYKQLTKLRREGFPIICLDRKYGYSETVEQLEEYTGNRLRNIAGQVKGVQRLHKQGCNYLGIESDFDRKRLLMHLKEEDEDKDIKKEVKKIRNS